MTVTVYRSSDASAPSLTGQVGSLNSLLYACLVTGYGAKAAAGWSRTYNDAGNNTSVFRQGSGPMHYLRVNDNAPGAGGARESRLVGYEAMTDVNTGTGPFPTAAQMANGVFARKSATADGTVRSWMLVATAKMCHLFMYAGDVASRANALSFGSIYSIVPAEGYATILIGRDTENTGATTGDKFQYLSASAATGSAVAAHYMARSYTGVGGSVAVSKCGDNMHGTQSYVGGTGGVAYPFPPDNSLLISPLKIATGNYYRGALPGAWNPLHTEAFANGDTVDGVGGLASRTFEVVMLMTGQVLVETSNTWDEN